ncbi:hypothetical protein CPT_Metamorpho_054 [Klebsiella phage Metamorpho]|nr:hypothetical protein CPT_Metamorpho_054 [Klebsiella phage Metamorpho]
MFPTYSEVVKVALSQIVSNHLFEVLDNSLKAKIHAEFVNVINLLIPNTNKIELDMAYDHFVARVKIGAEDEAELTVTVFLSITDQTVTTHVV